MEQQRLEQLKQLIEESKLPEDKKEFWLDAIEWLPELIVYEVYRRFVRLHNLKQEKKIWDAFAALSPEELTTPEGQRKAILSLRKEFVEKEDIKKAEEISARLKGESKDKQEA